MKRKFLLRGFEAHLFGLCQVGKAYRKILGSGNRQGKYHKQIIKT